MIVPLLMSLKRRGSAVTLADQLRHREHDQKSEIEGSVLHFYALRC